MDVDLRFGSNRTCTWQHHTFQVDAAATLATVSLRGKEAAAAVPANSTAQHDLDRARVRPKKPDERRMHQFHAFLLNVDRKMANLYYLLGSKSIFSCATGVQIRSQGVLSRN
jgi:hypothetical protein